MKTPMLKIPMSQTKGFTLIEVIVVVAAISAVTSLGYMTASSVRESAQQNKLDADVAAVNSAVQMYLASGGSIPANATEEGVLAKLKTRSDVSAAEGTLGMAGSFLDARVTSEVSSGSSKLKAYWDSGSFRFYTKTSADPGIVSFGLDEVSSGGAVATESRMKTLVASDVTGGQPKWIWDYSDTSPAAWTGNTGVAAPSAGLLAYLSQQFQGGGLEVTSADGMVDIGHLFRDAGYNSRLGLFSLEGMGADVFDLSTAEGAKAFLEEAIRRVLSNSTQGRLVADASQSGSVGSTRNNLQFRAGDMLGAILIPNGSFQQALTDLGNVIPNNQLYPLLSLSLPTDRAPFYESQMAYLGNGVYAIEDITGLTSDQDYNDFLFRTVDLAQLPDSQVKRIDPLTYYLAKTRSNGTVQPEYIYWNNPSPISGKSLKQTLIDTGVLLVNPVTGELTASQA